MTNLSERQILRDKLRTFVAADPSYRDIPPRVTTQTIGTILAVHEAPHSTLLELAEQAERRCALLPAHRQEPRLTDILPEQFGRPPTLTSRSQTPKQQIAELRAATVRLDVTVYVSRLPSDQSHHGTDILNFAVEGSRLLSDPDYLNRGRQAR